MGVYYKNTDSITLGNGIITWGTGATQTLGLLLGDVTFSYTVDMLKLEAGIPIMLVKQAKSSENASLTAEFCEFDAENLQAVMGLPDSAVSTIANGTQLNFGGSASGMNEIPELTFTHTRPDGKIIRVVFHKAAVNGTAELTFSDGAWSSSNVTFDAIADFDKAAGSQLGYISITSV